MTTPTPESAPRQPLTPGEIIVRIGALISGAFVFIAIDFILAAFSPAWSFEGSTARGTGPGQIVLSWVITIGAFLLLLRMHRWAGYGMLAGFAGLFMLLLFAGSSGPYVCFNTYGYPFR